MLENISNLPLPAKLSIYTLFIGIGATAIMDVWTIFLRVAFNVKGLDFALVGRWIGHMPSGKFMHQSIGKSPKIAGEALTGWTAHYVIGVMYAAVVVFFWGEAWVNAPRIMPAIIVGVVTVVVPFFVMQPCFGLGIAGSKTPKPYFARLKSVSSHFVFGMGIYVSALLANTLF